MARPAIPSPDEVEAVLDAAGPASDAELWSDHEAELAPGREFLRKLSEPGWAVPTWPSEYGGCDASRSEAAAIAAAVAKVAIPDLQPFGIGLAIVGPTIVTHGTDDQKQRWLRKIATGDRIVCQMFSEPDAGSDVANIATRAVRDGDGWRLAGQKVWTSRGQFADWGLCLARTDTEAPKHRGLTMFMLDMRSPGVMVAPLLQMDGDVHFTEIFVDGPVVPDEDRVGDVGQGWAVAMTVLANERAGISAARPLSSGPWTPPAWLRSLAERGLLDHPVLHDRAMSALIHERVADLSARRAAAEARAGTPGPAGSGGKLRVVQTFKERAALMLDADGAAGMLTDSTGIADFLLSPSMSLRGGTDEIQRNIIGERILGLPGDVRLDRDVPWSQSRKSLL